MFTGIIEEVGTVRAVQRGAHSSRLTVGADCVLSDLKIGDSVAVNGVCLTAASLDADSFTADVMHETLNRSSLGRLTAGGHVNLERAMTVGGRFGGHIVSGHIDGTGRIAALRRDDNAVWYTVEPPPALLRYIVEKGSITLDGVSLTVAAVTAETFSVSVIPHTAQQTILHEKRPGDTVNLETDILGKYVERLLQPREKPSQSGGLTADFLTRHGF